jgi:superfamily II DNA or RNA helicase
MQFSLLDTGRWRDYQLARIGQAVPLLRDGKNTMLEMATGVGKTWTGAGICKVLSGSVLWTAHRIELVRQAREALDRACQEPIGMEMPGMTSNGERLVVASKDSVITDKRLARLKERKFDYIVIDEAHHAAASSYRKLTAAFPGAALLGLSATPYRFDRKNLPFAASCDPYRLPQAMADGWLVPFLAKRVRIESIDVSGIDVVAGDLSVQQLRDLTLSEQNLTAVSQAIQANVGARPTIVYCVAVDVAERMAELLGGRAVSQRTKPGDRRKAFDEFGKGYQFLCNVAVATEGTDLPAAACIAMYRITLSPGLFQQMLGRGARPEPGIKGETPNERLDWIRNSSKPDCLVLDFVGNAGRHPVCTVAAAFTDDEEAAAGVSERLDRGEVILAGDATAEEEQKAQRKRVEAKERARLRVRITAEAEEIALIGLGGSEWAEVADLTGAPTPKQMQTWRALGINGTPLSRKEARDGIVKARKSMNLASPDMVSFLLKHYPGMDVETVTQKQARALQMQKLRKWGRV